MNLQNSSVNVCTITYIVLILFVLLAIAAVNSKAQWTQVTAYQLMQLHEEKLRYLADISDGA